GHARLGVADHDDAFADAQEGVHDAGLVLGGHGHSGNVTEAHEPLGLPAERALVELDGLRGRSVEIEIRVQLFDRHWFLLFLRGHSAARSGRTERTRSSRNQSPPQRSAATSIGKSVWVKSGLPTRTCVATAPPR